MRGFRVLVGFILALMASCPAEAQFEVRIKDIASVQGARGNYLFGYGLVIGLNGTGDTLEKRAVYPAVLSLAAGSYGCEYQTLM